jgi:hypothetical protein
MTHKLRTALTAMLLLGLVAGGAGAAAADTTDIDNDTVTIINDGDLIDFDNVLSNITTNILGIQLDDGAVSVASASMY